MDDSTVMTRERLDELANQIAEFSLHIDLAQHALFTHLREFDAHDGWANSGFGSTAAWLAWRIDIGIVTAREHVRVARALGEFKLIDNAFAAGELSYSKVRAMTRVATPEIEQGLLDIATHATASQIEKLAAAYRRARVDPATPAMNVRRFVRRSDTDSGMVRIEIQLPPEQANLFWEAMNAALDAGRHENDSAESNGSRPVEDASAESLREVDSTVLQAERADAIVSVAQAYLQHSPRTLGSGYELVVLTTKDQLVHGPGGVGGFLRDGTPVPLHIARMLACDCSRVDVETSASGEILDVGRARRTIPSAIGRALRLRDGGCRVPGCGRKHHLQAHHIEAWAEGGKTSASNLVLLCPSHHTLVHEGQLRVGVRDGKLEFRNGYWLEIRPAPARGRALGREAVEAGVRGKAIEFERFPRWDGSRMDLGAAVNWMCAANGASSDSSALLGPRAGRSG
jgi:hypothetical protein